MEQQAILALGAVTLISCGVGLLFVHSSNPLLKGLNWMGGALVMGGVAAALMLGNLWVPALQPVANLLALFAFMCCYRADQYLLCHEARQTALGFTLIAIQVAMVPLQWLHLAGPRMSAVVLGTVLSIQIEVTARLLHRSSVSGARFPVRFTAGLMRCLVFANVVYAVIAAAGFLNRPRQAYLVQTLTYILFIAVAIGLGFAFFWRTTTKLTAELEHMASTDPLTRVFNRRVFMAWCEKELLRSRESGLPLSVLFIDFDHFKRINDSFGHQVGDQVLCAAVERMQDSIRGIDVLCRWGGEEFAVLLPNASPEATLLVAERMRQNLRLVNSEAEPFANYVRAEFQLTASIGAASFAQELDTVDAMLHRADTALYEAKDAGRDRVILAARPSAEEPEVVRERSGLRHGRLAEAN